ncbi:response regulator [Hyphomicrobium sp. CS1GBMeth3]|uniref:response regulator transcription factor n=1 Tax=Hyphomicrobium sp. CS1GBMeth3 TaxID=1892845 RepID=UPI0009303176|nr:response regulator [Hyphomicrobium sp. CS1GBMeth3]
MTKRDAEVTVALIDDDAAVLHSMRLLIESRDIPVACYGSAEAFLEELPGNKPSCVVADVRMPGMTGLELQRELKYRNNEAPLILISGHADVSMAVQALKEGAFDFFEKPYDGERLATSVSDAVQKGRRQTSEASERVDIAERLKALSPRQREVLEFVASGMSNKQIAAKLSISPRTVETYRAWVMERMGAQNVADLVRKVSSFLPAEQR